MDIEMKISGSVPYRERHHDRGTDYIYADAKNREIRITLGSSSKDYIIERDQIDLIILALQQLKAIAEQQTYDEYAD